MSGTVPATQLMDGVDRVILTSHSIDNLFDYCTRKFEFLNVYDRRPPRDSGFAASVGTALHEAIQGWQIKRAEGLDEEYATAYAFYTLLRYYPWEDEAAQSTQLRSHTNCISMLIEVMRMPFWDQWELVRVADHGWAVEVPFLLYHTSLGKFRVKNTGETCMLGTQGKIDLIMRHRLTGEIRCIDIKTTNKEPGLVRSEYTWSGQQIGYGQVLQAMLGESLNKFEVWYLVARFNAGEPASTEAMPYPKGEDDVDDYWLAKLERLERMKRYAETGWFPRRNGGCNSYKNECSMFTICESRDPELINAWFSGIGAPQQEGYAPWVTLEL